MPLLHRKESACQSGARPHDGLPAAHRPDPQGWERLVSVLSTEKMFIYVPLLKWYAAHGAEITAVHKTINYRPKIFPWFVEQVTEVRRTGDAEKSKALLAKVFKHLGNSAYAKMRASSSLSASASGSLRLVPSGHGIKQGFLHEGCADDNL